MNRNILNWPAADSTRKVEKSISQGFSLKL